jgi:acetolactate decarboxylase
MRRIIVVATLFVCLNLSAAQAWQSSQDTLYQVSTLNALFEGIYDGNTTFKDIRKHGDFGIGTFNGLDGEMIAVDGKFYQIKSNGFAYPVNDAQKSPFAMVKFFRSEKTVYVERSFNYDYLVRYLDQIITSRNLPAAVKIEGLFSYVKLRSVPKQNKPYSKLSEVVKTQSVFEYRNIRGTIVGFRMPDYFKGMNAPGYHFHFLSEDRKFGGHLLGCETRDIKIFLDDSKEFKLILPDHGEFLKTDLMKDYDNGLE